MYVYIAIYYSIYYVSRQDLLISIHSFVLENNIVYYEFKYYTFVYIITVFFYLIICLFNVKLFDYVFIFFKKLPFKHKNYSEFFFFIFLWLIIVYIYYNIISNIFFNFTEYSSFLYLFILLYLYTLLFYIPCKFNYMLYIAISIISLYTMFM